MILVVTNEYIQSKDERIWLTYGLLVDLDLYILLDPTVAEQ